jgi:hypothetical protein
VNLQRYIARLITSQSPCQPAGFELESTITILTAESEEQPVAKTVPQYRQIVNKKLQWQILKRCNNGILEQMQKQQLRNIDRSSIDAGAMAVLSKMLQWQFRATDAAMPVLQQLSNDTPETATTVMQQMLLGQ